MFSPSAWYLQNEGLFLFLFKDLGMGASLNYCASLAFRHQDCRAELRASQVLLPVSATDSDLGLEDDMTLMETKGLATPGDLSARSARSAKWRRAAP